MTIKKIALGLVFGLLLLGARALLAQERAYVTNQQEDTVSVIDTTNLAADVETIGPIASPLGIAANPAGTRVYVTGVGRNTITVIDTSVVIDEDPDSDPILGTITIGGAADAGIAVSPDGRRLYVPIAVGGGGSVSVVDVENDANIEIATVTDLPAPNGCWGSNTRFSPPSRNIFPWAIAVSPDGNYLYTTSAFWSSDVCVISANSVTDTYNVTGVASAGGTFQRSFSSGITVLPDNSAVYYGDSLNGILYRFNPGGSPPTPVAAWNDPNGPWWIAAPDSNTLYISDSDFGGGTKVSDVDLSLAVPEQKIDMGPGSYPYGLAATANGSQVYVVNSGNNTISVINTSDNSVLAPPIPVGDGPQYIAIASPQGPGPTPVVTAVPSLPDLGIVFLILALTVVGLRSLPRVKNYTE